ncbi:uncharacterized protein KD926_005279 [Aspergillus affinis]|uniref:uncharacterized protein n=1 Tax=Aspergillus affinis TaxID=1070780 RepID=UPI0022FDCFA2|nr:uncharacterized protein KD926_005279 [Aspergillus affinis]KAI9042673.1 hypothetical protein KD926_005279 [Aspergillus affinis]
MQFSNIGSAVMATLTFALTVQAAAVPETAARAVEKRACPGGGHAECMPLLATTCQMRCSGRNPIRLEVCNEKCIQQAILKFHLSSPPSSPSFFISHQFLLLRGSWLLDFAKLVLWSIIFAASLGTEALLKFWMDVSGIVGLGITQRKDMGL